MSAFSWARPGVEVVCVANGFRFRFAPTRLELIRSFFCRDPKFREKVVITGRYEAYGSTYVWLHGFRFSYNAVSFRPLVRKSQSEDIALFKRIASDQPVEGV